MYLMARVGREQLDNETNNGMPSDIASETASEKLSTTVIDITVEARQRFRAFSTMER